MILTFDQKRKFFEHHLPGEKIGTRNKVSVRCPFHDENTPSCTLFLDGNGGFNCHACGARGNCFQFQARISGSTLAEAERQVAKITGAELHSVSHGFNRIGPVVASYDYRGLDGQLLFQKRRHELPDAAKTFRIYRPDGTGWRSGLDPDDGPRTERVLYNQNLLTTANLVFVCEGEKDCDSIALSGLYSDKPEFRTVAVTSFDGAWRPGQTPKWLDQYNRSFADKHVVIFEDNDESGRTFSSHIAEQIYPYAAAVRIVRFDDQPEKSDVSDFLATHNVKDLVALIKTTKRWSPAAKERPKAMFEDVVSFASAEIAPVRWLVEDVIPFAGNGIICGDPKASKSFHAIDLALSLASGADWLGRNVPRRVRSALVSREDSPGLTQRRVTKLMRGRPDYVRAEGWMLVNTRKHSTDFKVMNTAQLDRLILEVKEFGAEFVILDVFRSIHDAEENDNDQMPRVLEQVNRIQNECNCAVALVHHLNKKDSENIFRGLRGASAIHGWMEWGIGISVVNPEAEDKADYVRKLEFENKEGVSLPIYSRITAGSPDVIRIERVDSPTARRNRPGIPGATRQSLQ